jgi:hypothetical protein
VSFVAITSEHKFFGPAACNFVNVPHTYQGLFGLGGAALAVSGTGSYLGMLESTSTLGDAFDVQLCNTGGRLWLGGYDPAFTTAAPVFTPVIATSPFYAVVLSDIRVGGTSLGIGQATFGDTLVSATGSWVQMPERHWSTVQGFWSSHPKAPMQDCAPACRTETSAKISTGTTVHSRITRRLIVRPGPEAHGRPLLVHRARRKPDSCGRWSRWRRRMAAMGPPAPVAIAPLPLRLTQLPFRRCPL